MVSLIGLLLFLLGSCVGVVGIRSDVQQPVRPIEPPSLAQVVIFTEEQAAQASYLIFEEIESYWEPTFQDVALLETFVDTYLREELAEVDLAERFRDYYRQYFGYVVDGERYIYGNFFCEIPSEFNWRNTLLDVMDGGDCYFQVQYRVQDGAITALTINGEA